MNSPLWLGVVLAAALLAGLIARYRLPRERPPAVNTDPLSSFVEFPAVIVFGSQSCVSCAPVLAALHAEGIAFSQFSWEDHARQIEELQILQVPTTWAVDGDGNLRMAVEGPLSRQQLRLLKLQSRR